ncbi:uncharacterized protein PAN0_076c6622 [Moesziomyces antarcticus]|uniref:Glutaredoxin-like protein n=2 Tax=Pseudozyma antarctica TaxID=84753 RepID=A0A081CNX9_PSEA2|nr:uncharacterized protein PAN0_076c6622 [Moesziomyces antarcticus]GAK68375.1 conserved hypothetical protein [Moesziomyces antarcticus]
MATKKGAFLTASIDTMIPSLRLLSAQTGRVFKLTLYTGTDCQLCDVMRNEIATAAQHVPLTLATYNIRDDSLDDVHYWRRKYQYDIPVLHLDGQEIFRHRLKAAELVAKLQHARNEK